MFDTVTTQYLLDNYKEIWSAMCERDDRLEEKIREFSEDPLVKSKLYLDGMSEEQLFERIRFAVVVLETSLGEEALGWLFQYPSSTFIIPTAYTVETAVQHNLAEQDLIFPIRVNVAGALCGELSPTDPKAILEIVTEGLCLGEGVGEFVNNHIEIQVPAIH